MTFGFPWNLYFLWHFRLHFRLQNETKSKHIFYRFPRTMLIFVMEYKHALRRAVISTKT